MKEQRYISDTTLRDGEQSPGFALSKEQKIAVALMLDSIGVHRIDAGIPAMGVIETDAAQEIMHLKKNAQISLWCRLSENDIRLAGKCSPDIIHISIPVSYVQIYSKLKKNKTWLLKQLSCCVELAQSYNKTVTVGFEDASRADITFMLCLIEKLGNMGVDCVSYADTVGVLTPSVCAGAVRDFVRHSGMEVKIHAHNDLGMAVANTIAGLKAGAKYAETTLLGIGERAGNCSFSKLLYACDRLFDFGISSLKARESEERFYAILGGLPPAL